MTYGDRTIAVVVPAYNESGFIGDVIETVPAFVDRVYAIDDRSTDTTWAEIREAAERANRRRSGPDGGEWAVPIRHEENQGVGGAIKTGYTRALADGMEVLAVMNGDGQMDPDQLHRLIHPVAVGDAGYAKGDRLSHPGYREGMSAWRSFGNHLLATLTRLGSGYWRMHDPQNGYTAASREALETIDYESAYDRYGFCNDLLVRFNVAGVTLVDVPMPAVYGDETSHIRYSQFAPGLSLLLFKSFLRRVAAPLVASRDDDRGRLAPLLYLGGLAVALAGLLTGVRDREAPTRSLPGGLGLFAGGMAADARANAGLYRRAPATDAAAAPEAPEAETGSGPGPGDGDGGGGDPDDGTGRTTDTVDTPAGTDRSDDFATLQMDADETDTDDGGTERTNGRDRTHEQADGTATDGGASGSEPSADGEDDG